MKRINDISDIPDRNYEGYVWLSDADKPEVLKGDKTFDFAKYEEGSNPFVIEALLHDKEQNISVHIRHTGKYHIYEFDLNNLPEGAELEDVQYLPHRLNGVEKVNIKQLWLPEADENCENMPVLKMQALIFTGFDYNNK